MKKKAVIAIVVVCMFGVMAVFMSASNKTPQTVPTEPDAAVKICPHSGLPCDGDGDCESDSGTNECAH